MANLTDEQKKDMQNTAGFSSESLAERLNQELARASSLRDDMEALAPSQHRTAEMIGDVSNLPAGMSPTQARLRGTAAGTAFAAAQSQYGQANVLEVLGQMMKLQQEKEDSSIRQRQMNIAEQQFAQEMAANGMVWDSNLNTVRGMTDEERKEQGYFAVSPTTQSYVDLIKNGSIKTISQIPAEDRSKVVGELARQNISIPELIAETEGKNLSGAIRVLYERYGADKGEDQDLSRGKIGGGVTWLGSLVGLAPEAKQYNQLKKGLASSVKELVGESGIMTDEDANRLIGLLPKITDNNEEARLAWEDLDKFIYDKYGTHILDEEGDNEYDEADRIIEEQLNKKK